MKIRVSLALFVLYIVTTQCIQAQITGELPPLPDTTMIFQPARPLLEESVKARRATNKLGLDLLFTASGWGVGGMYGKQVSDDLMVYTHLFIGSRRHTDEFEDAYYGNVPVVSTKVNRLLAIPLSFGVQYRAFSSLLQESFRPFVTAGVSPTLIVATPYIRDNVYYEYFQSFGYTTSYVRMGGFVGIGANFGSMGKGSNMAVQVRYFVIPFGGNGIESLRDVFIKDMGGIALSLTIGTSY